MADPIVVLATRAGRILAANAFFGTRAPVAPGSRPLVLERPAGKTDRDIEAEYEIASDDQLVPKPTMPSPDPSGYLGKANPIYEVRAINRTPGGNPIR